jgi:heptosyltransferase I
MRVLVIKTSSMGDVIHTLPALTDAARAHPGIRFDWAVEENFAEIPAWHPAVERVIPVALRRWRRHPLKAWRSGEWAACKDALGTTRYDAVIDAQGLLKSAFLSRYAQGPVHSLDRWSAREPLSSHIYTRPHPHAVAWGNHAVERVRTLFAAALDYPRPTTDCDYGLDRQRILMTDGADTKPYLVFLHGTTWPTKHWPETYWRRLAETADAAGWAVRLPWGNASEKERAERLAAGLERVSVLPRQNLAGMAAQLAGARACVAVDTGLGHLAAAFDVPTLSLFGPTNPGYTGAWGPRQRHLASDFPCAPCLKKRCAHRPSDQERATFDLDREHPLCFTRLPPERVWQAVLDQTARG